MSRSPRVRIRRLLLAVVAAATMGLFAGHGLAPAGTAAVHTGPATAEILPPLSLPAL